MKKKDERRTHAAGMRFARTRRDKRKQRDVPQVYRLEDRVMMNDTLIWFGHTRQMEYLLKMYRPQLQDRRPRMMFRNILGDSIQQVEEDWDRMNENNYRNRSR